MTRRDLPVPSAGEGHVDSGTMFLGMAGLSELLRL